MERVATLEARRADYADDIAAWAESQAALLRAGRLESIDVENIAEEIESLARSDRHALRSHIAIIIEHLLKLMTSPSRNPRAGWIKSIRKARNDIEFVLSGSPSLRRELPALVESSKVRGTAAAEKALRTYGEFEDDARRAMIETRLTPDQILGDWFPEA